MTEGNKLSALTLNGDEPPYRYDCNGNTTYDGRQKVTMRYNYLNLISTIDENIELGGEWETGRGNPGKSKDTAFSDLEMKKM